MKENEEAMMSDETRIAGLQGLATELLRNKGEAALGAGIARARIIQEQDAARRAQSDSESQEIIGDYWRHKAMEAEKAVAIKDALLKEWMHGNEAFKRLARKYGKKLGVSDEQRQNDFEDCLLEAAEEKPEFADTKATKAVKEARGIK